MPPEPFGMFAAFGAMAIVMFLVMIAVDAVFLWLGARFAKIEDATFGKAFIATLGGLIISAILGSIIPIIGGILGLAAYLWIVKTVFNTDWGKAVIAWLFAIVIAIVLMVIIGIIVGISVMAAP
ncbi:hypothetical protein PAP_00875 [Palaeococcus pacificus DY20341]|uniref:Yip1 domain-containing protein n=1 Tax=Palaeococcus pacificus DY20341 TaxID=1343739 RepID=A0A075LW06_9EURY|nr:hypothetical protein [Palaeococcus pacificus]AIF68618.1 hypothetical protein PAP_00875 [Palaeococcus pacificus DY20341]